jgi:hypothetical protein
MEVTMEGAMGVTTEVEKPFTLSIRKYRRLTKLTRPSHSVYQYANRIVRANSNSQDFTLITERFKPN